MTQSHGEDLAREFGNAHENFPGNPPLERAMDLYKNAIGRTIGATHRATIARRPNSSRGYGREASVEQPMKPTVQLLLMLSLLWTAACGRDEVRLPTLEATVQQRIASQDETPISLADATEFSWDRVYIFEPYTPYDVVLQTIGSSWDGVQQTAIATRDDAVLLVFMRAGEVAAFTMYSRGNGDLADARTPTGLTPEQAIFIARRVERGEPWTILQLADGHVQEEGAK